MHSIVGHIEKELLWLLYVFHTWKDLSFELNDDEIEKVKAFYEHVFP